MEVRQVGGRAKWSHIRRQFELDEAGFDLLPFRSGEGEPEGELQGGACGEVHRISQKEPVSSSGSSDSGQFTEVQRVTLTA